MYKTIYNNLIQKRIFNLPEGYAEEHHIIPRSLGGCDDKSNLVLLTAREHYLAHYLLMKMQTKNSDNYFSMVKAFLMMQVDNGTGLRYIPSHKFEELRKIDSERKSICMKGSSNPTLGKIWIRNPDTNEKRLIIKDDDIPIGFYCGLDVVKKKCLICNTEFINKKRIKTCSEKCRIELISKSLSGEKCGSVKLNWLIVSDIRNGKYSDLNNQQIADMFSVSKVTIHYIKTYKKWVK